MLNMSSVADFFLGISRKVFRAAILKEDLSMDRPYFITEHFWMSASYEAALKFFLMELNPPQR